MKLVIQNKKNKSTFCIDLGVSISKEKQESISNLIVKTLEKLKKQIAKELNEEDIFVTNFDFLSWNDSNSIGILLTKAIKENNVNLQELLYLLQKEYYIVSDLELQKRLLEEKMIRICSLK